MVQSIRRGVSLTQLSWDKICDAILSNERKPPRLRASCWMCWKYFLFRKIVMSIVNKCRNAEPGNPDPAIPNLAAAFEIRDSYYKCFLNVSVGRQKSELASGLHISYIPG